MVKLLPFYLHCVPLEGYTPYIMVCILFHLSTLTNLFLLFYASDACTSFGKTSSRKPLNTGCLSELMRLGIYSTTHTWFVFTQITSCSPIGIKRNGFLPVTSKVSIASFVTPDVTYPLKISVLPLYFARTRAIHMSAFFDISRYYKVLVCHPFEFDPVLRLFPHQIKAVFSFCNNAFQFARLCAI